MASVLMSVNNVESDVLHLFIILANNYLKG